MPTSRRRVQRLACVAVAYVMLSALATWPLLRHLSTTIASDPGDPLLNASILVWNATTVPFSARWWDAPHFYPSPGVIAFTENLLGVVPLTTPVYWLTGNAFLAYNLVVFLTWPLSAVAGFLLVRRLSGRDDAAFLAGLAFAFSPYRAVALGHLQTLATFGVPLMLVGLHGFLEQRRRAWLLLFGLAWIFQGLANGYYVLYGGLLVGVWLLYFCSRRSLWTPGLTIVAALAVSSLPLAPMLVRYRQIHADLGLHRTLNEILFYSAKPASWFEVGSNVWLWHSVLPDGKDDLFPGLTVVVLAAAGVLYTLGRREGTALVEPAGRRRLRRVLLGLVGLAVAAILVGLRYGPIDATIGGFIVRMRTLDRALWLLLLAGLPLVWMTPRLREAVSRRSPLVFYACGAIVFGVLCCGPVLRVGEQIVLDPAPYGWLMPLPGFNELRVPTQVKMIHLLCLAVTAGLGFAFLPLKRPAARVVFALAAVGLLADGWMSEVPLAATPSLWAEVEPAGRPEPILELPLGPEYDTAATYRASVHHRRLLNGVSGYDPAHYDALKEALAAHDPAMLTAIASLGAFDIVVDGAADPGGALAQYAAAAPGAMRAASDGTRTLFRVPAGPPRPALGPPLPIAGASAGAHPPNWKSMYDGRVDTAWAINPQSAGDWVIADLGSVGTVAGVTEVLADHPLDYPRALRVELSLDGEQWETVWAGPTAAEAFLALAREPRVGALQVAFAPAPARYVRLQLTSDRPGHQWWIAELRIRGPLAPERR